MKFPACIILLASILGIATAVSTPKEYHLKSEVKPNQEFCKARFNNLYIQGYHTGAGLGDATLSTNSTADASKFYLVPTTKKLPNGKTSNLAQFDFGTPFAWTFGEWCIVERHLASHVRHLSPFNANNIHSRGRGRQCLRSMGARPHQRRQRLEHQHGDERFLPRRRRAGMAEQRRGHECRLWWLDR